MISGLTWLGLGLDDLWMTWLGLGLDDLRIDMARARAG